MKAVITVIIILISSVSYSQSISLDCNSVGTVNYKPAIILGFR